MRSDTQTITVERSPEEVFAFVADPRNDPSWCPRVRWVERSDGGDRPARGARYAAQHSPTLIREHVREIEIVGYDPPGRVRTRQEDEVAVFEITYLVEPAGEGSCRLTQRDEIRWKVSRATAPLAGLIVRRHMRDQLRRLKRLLEAE